MVHKKALLWFLCLAFLPAWMLFCVPLLFGAPGSEKWQLASLPCWALAMWAPGLAAMLTQRVVMHHPLRALKLKRLGEKSVYVWAWLGPILLTLFTGGLTLILGTGHLDTELTLLRQSLGEGQSKAIAAPGFLLLIQVAFAITLAPLINSLFALGEELGWRGFLLPQLLPLGKWRAIGLSGAIWGIWHAPAVLQGLNYPGHPITGVFSMIGFCMLLSVFLSWLYLRADSPWAPALAHGSLNAIAGLPLIFLKDVDQIFGGTLASLSGWIPLTLLAVWLAWKPRWTPRPAIAPLTQESQSIEG